ncbi:hypothetical protein M752DRAFT_324478 [Aspergillus phoenicis ATCC 13157]|uniref:Uncharacterized protein n=1 Tax=Aspergillus phoenicis ATCC 13157 TaxID=1353007 RepID=A0A370PTQ9_ASPPH|nr:hypothetical protein M752DRAFT_324478 [Aspergillus phoenicis ATCC 13157]
MVSNSNYRDRTLKPTALSIQSSPPDSCNSLPTHRFLRRDTRAVVPEHALSDIGTSFSVFPAQPPPSHTPLQTAGVFESPQLGSLPVSSSLPQQPVMVAPPVSTYQMQQMHMGQAPADTISTSVEMQIIRDDGPHLPQPPEKWGAIKGCS